MRGGGWDCIDQIDLIGARRCQKNANKVGLVRSVSTSWNSHVCLRYGLWQVVKQSTRLEPTAVGLVVVPLILACGFNSSHWQLAVLQLCSFYIRRYCDLLSFVLNEVMERPQNAQTQRIVNYNVRSCGMVHRFLDGLSETGKGVRHCSIGANCVA